MRTFILYITHSGEAIAARLKEIFPDAQVLKFRDVSSPLHPFTDISDIWHEAKNLIFIMATGIVVRTIAPLIKDKKTDPAVVVLDEKGRFVISLLSGHLGGANELTKKVAEYLGAEAVITTSSDINNHTPIDLWAEKNGLVIEDWSSLPAVMTRLINKGSLKVYVDSNISCELPDDLLPVREPSEAEVIITNRLSTQFHAFYLRPLTGALILGIGCNSGTGADEIEDAVKKVFNKYGLSFKSIHSIATIDLKAREKGIVDFAKRYGFNIVGFSPEELNGVSGIAGSEAVLKATGARAVSEPAALLASGAEGLLIPKQKIGNVTVAVAEKPHCYPKKSSTLLPQKVFDFLGTPFWGPQHMSALQPKIYIVGTGPGGIEHITPYAREVLMTSDVIVGYGTYLDLIKDLVKDKEVISTGMTQEIERAEKAVELALSGRTVSVISGGDPGIYGMAGLVLEVLKAKQGTGDESGSLYPFTSSPLHPLTNLPICVKVIPGISALNACASRLGAPLMHDFAVISLSDRLTDWQLIESRLEAVAKADFVTILYNPRSKGRPEHIKRAREIFLRYRSPDTPVGIVKSAMRKNEVVSITTLGDMPVELIDMQTTVIIGNSQTFTWNDYMITPRGYERKIRRIS